MYYCHFHSLVAFWAVVKSYRHLSTRTRRNSSILPTVFLVRHFEIDFVIIHSNIRLSSIFHLSKFKIKNVRILKFYGIIIDWGRRMNDMWFLGSCVFVYVLNLAYLFYIITKKDLRWKRILGVQILVNVMLGSPLLVLFILKLFENHLLGN